jgi:hypothetical protein
MQVKVKIFCTWGFKGLFFVLIMTGSGNIGRASTVIRCQSSLVTAPSVVSYVTGLLLKPARNPIHKKTCFSGVENLTTFCPSPVCVQRHVTGLLLKPVSAELKILPLSVHLLCVCSPSRDRPVIETCFSGVENLTTFCPSPVCVFNVTWQVCYWNLFQRSWESYHLLSISCVCSTSRDSGDLEEIAVNRSNYSSK